MAESRRVSSGGILAVVGYVSTAVVIWIALAAPGAAGASQSGAISERASGTAYASGYVALVGHGWGHGRGMGQWGALGYALSAKSYPWLLGHYYGGTSPGTVGNPDIRVAINGNDGKDVIVTSQSAFSVAGIQFSPGEAALMYLTASAGVWGIEVSSSCAGGPSHTWTPVGSAQDPVAVPSDQSAAASSSQVLQLCQVGGNMWLRGDIQAWDYSASARTVNVVPLESYLQGVVPAEMPAYWGQLGQPGPQSEPWGFQALEAQAVAARSYVMADLGRLGYADICNTDSCQSYLGMGVESPITNAAIAATAGQVRIFASGRVAATEYSSSTGGYTAGGTFPAVVDAGDSVCVPNACNPHHTWRVAIAVSAIEGAYPQVGTLKAVVVTKRNGYGSLGGRVESLVLEGSRGSVTLAGYQFAYTFGLQSNWFAVTSVPSGGVGGYWMAGGHGGVFSFGDAHFYGSMGSRPLNAPIVGIAGVPGGGGYWLVASDGGVFSFGDAHFYGSMGSRPLNAPIVGIAGVPGGGGYWLVASDGGVFSFGDAHFFGSLGSHPPSSPVGGITATLAGQGYLIYGASGSVDSFGDAPQFGDLPTTLNGYGGRIVGLAVRT